MIAKLTGVLDDIRQASLLVRVEGGLTYEVLAPAYTAGRLGASIGQTITLHTLYYLQSENQGSSFIPRLAGFLTADDKAFFQLLTTVKGIGNRKALRAMAIATSQIAAAIADRDAALLQSLPDVGRRTADTIIAELSGKVDAFLHSAAGSLPGAVVDTAASGSTAGETSGADQGGRSLARESVEVLVQLGENRLQALRWVEEALAAKDRPGDVQAILARVYKIKAGT
ncbi:MAG: hypothetical protein HC898_12685 [Phycisphaerales bacterium]|nr:hypothetical protein [Phycisphaerales bacterium]